MVIVTVRQINLFVVGFFFLFLTYLRVKEDLRSQKPLISHINSEFFLTDGIDAGVLLNPLGAVCVILVELFHKIWAHIAEPFLKRKL